LSRLLQSENQPKLRRCEKVNGESEGEEAVDSKAKKRWERGSLRTP
jgi:hypothetical protein